jgi:Asp-tRNA(Asn)/Glu-tRNA(Gln) amidotransferase A subunit family amidase
MQKTNPRPDGEDGNLDRAAFDATLTARGIMLSREEADSVFALATWLSDGVAKLSDAFPAAERSGTEAADLSIPEAGKRMRSGQLTSVGLVQAALARIAERDKDYLSFYVVDAERALDAARRADAELTSGHDRGPLHGIPVGIKDMIDVAELPTTAGSKGREGKIAPHNAEVVDRLIEGGAIIMGKLATYEWGTVGPAYDTLYPPARNPWSLEHITGGSSSGCAAAVAGGQLRTTIGSDTGGSVRGPASYCGVVGLKPTFGAVSTKGTLGMSPTMDHVGPMSATTAEAALTLDVIAGRGGNESAIALLGKPIVGLRIAYARDWFARDPQATADVVAAMDAAASTLSELGAVIEQVTLPDYHAIEVAAAAVLHKEGFDGHAEELAAHPQGFGRKTYQSMVAGAAVTSAEYTEAMRAGEAFRATLDHQIFSSFDALVTVGTLTPALPVALFGKGSVWTPMRTIGFNLSGHPVLMLPMGFSDGLPLGMQIVGRHYGEARICQIGDAFERATDFSTQKAPQPPR